MQVGETLQHNWKRRAAVCLAHAFWWLCCFCLAVLLRYFTDRPCPWPEQRPVQRKIFQCAAFKYNIINLVANDFYPTLTDWIVTTLYVCRIANAQLFALPLSLLVRPSGSAHNTHQWMDVVGWGGGSEINFSEINCRISRINCKRFSNTLHSSLCGQLKWLLKIKISKSKNSIRYFRFGQPKILKRHTHTRYAYRFGNKSPGCDLLVTGASH